MNTHAAEATRPATGLTALITWALIALGSYHAAQASGIVWLLIPGAMALIELSRAATRRLVFYPMLALGLLFYAPQLGFFWTVFGGAAVALWMVLAFWLALFGLILRLVRQRTGPTWALVLAPFLWTGLEYFRCELYYLRFGWLTFGMGAHATPALAGNIGVFGVGFVIMAVAAALVHFARGCPRTAAIGLTTVTTALCLLTPALTFRPVTPKDGLHVVGVQLEFPGEYQVIAALNRAQKQNPEAQLFMLSEYTFQEPVPRKVREWCREKQVYLVVGGKEPLGETNFYNMAYVVGPQGGIVHQQAKSVPIQFFKDGLPAPRLHGLEFPWGKLGLPTCYDLSYTRVVDEFVRQGAVALLNPTMDLEDWGAMQHELHSHIAPMRAAEYGIPIFRVSSSGISQLVTANGRVLAQAPFPGNGKMLAGQLPLDARPALPWDRWLAPGCVGITVLALCLCLVPERLLAALRLRAIPHHAWA